MNIQEYISSGIVEAYVLGLASQEEVQEVLELRRQYPEMDDAIIQFELSLEHQHHQQAIAPPDLVKTALLARLENEFLDNEDQKNLSTHNIEAPAVVRPMEVQRSTAWLRYSAAAVLVAFLANAAITIWLYGRYKDVARQYAALQEESKREKVRINSLYADIYRMQDTKLKVIRMQGLPGKEGNLATVYWDQETGEVYLFKNKLPATAADKQYQLWAIVDGKPVDAGVIEKDCEGLCKQKIIGDKVQAFAITLEKIGGNPEPTLTEMMVLGGT